MRLHVFTNLLVLCRLLRTLAPKCLVTNRRNGILSQLAQDDYVFRANASSDLSLAAEARGAVSSLESYGMKDDRAPSIRPSCIFRQGNYRY